MATQMDRQLTLVGLSTPYYQKKTSLKSNQPRVSQPISSTDSAERQLH